MATEISVERFNGVYNFPFKDNSFYSVTLTFGVYRFEVWGASGGNQLGGASGQFIGEGGRGGYASGVFEVKKESMKLFCYVGGKGASYDTNGITQADGGFNGGGASIGRYNNRGGTGGGGSTDICFIKSEITKTNGRTLRTEESYKSRIIVGGGGGGGWGAKEDWSGIRFSSNGGNGGGIQSEGSGYGQSKGCGTNKCDYYNQGDSYTTSFNYVTGSTANSTGTVGCASSTSNKGINGAQPGSFGYGGSAINGWQNSGGGGGGGWFGGYGGTSGDNARGTGGAGGSGYIHNSSNHNFHSSLDSRFYLQEGIIFDGKSSFPSINPNNNETGHIGNGYARVTILSQSKPRTKRCLCFLRNSPFITPLLIAFSFKNC